MLDNADYQKRYPLPNQIPRLNGKSYNEKALVLGVSQSVIDLVIRRVSSIINGVELHESWKQLIGNLHDKTYVFIFHGNKIAYAQLSVVER